jgi:hypothetical protein
MHLDRSGLLANPWLGLQPPATVGWTAFSSVGRPFDGHSDATPAVSTCRSATAVGVHRRGAAIVGRTIYLSWTRVRRPLHS